MKKKFFCQRCKKENKNLVENSPMDSMMSSYFLVPETSKRSVRYSELESQILSPNNYSLILCPGCIKQFYTQKSLPNEKLRKEVQLYSTSLKELKLKSKPKPTSLSDALDYDYLSLVKELHELSITQRNVLLEKQSLVKRKASVEQQISEYWKSYYITISDLEIVRENEKSLENKIYYYDREYERLNSKCLHKYFKLDQTYDKKIGTINGLRLGKLKSMDVSWEEINAALGLCVLMLLTLAKQFKYGFKKYKLKARASNSVVVNIEKSVTYNLFYDGLNKSLDTFNNALVSLLGALKELFDHCEKKTTTGGDNIYFYEINGSMIGGFDIKFLPRQTENDLKDWTRATRRVILKLKYIQHQYVATHSLK